MIVDGVEVLAGGQIDNGKSFTLECNTDYIVVPSQSSTSSRRCSLGVISSSDPYECELGLFSFKTYFYLLHIVHYTKNYRLYSKVTFI